MFPSSRYGPLSRDAIERLINRCQQTVERHCLSLKGKRVTPQVLRHTAALQLLRYGIDRSVIALRLGHESTETTQMYLHADLRMKGEALEKVTPPDVARLQNPRASLHDDLFSGWADDDVLAHILKHRR